jgi:V/A-type H+/Na+-transporting ATPase subunit E
MGLEQVLEKIQKEGERDILRIHQEGELQADEILAQMKKKIQDLTKLRRDETEKMIRNLHIQEQSISELEAKKIRLNAEKEVLDETYQQCLESLQKLPHEHLIKSLLSKAKKELPDALYISSNQRDETLIRSLTNFTYKNHVDCLGGFILENQDGSLRLDYRYETLARQVWNTNLKNIVNILFR